MKFDSCITDGHPKYTSIIRQHYRVLPLDKHPTCLCFVGEILGYFGCFGGNGGVKGVKIQPVQGQPRPNSIQVLGIEQPSGGETVVTVAV